MASQVMYAVLLVALSGTLCLAQEGARCTALKTDENRVTKIKCMKVVKPDLDDASTDEVLKPIAEALTTEEKTKVGLCVAKETGCVGADDKYNEATCLAHIEKTALPADVKAEFVTALKGCSANKDISTENILKCTHVAWKGVCEKAA